ncbi:S49 family peptidase [Agrobacterium rhizogenes]|uniref:SDH family Clp fold serine proteinase n=1 Tax=Rhizobium rhizogenes TaxID=359 RepID=UPI001574B29D|nr:S49 family peptidase [Rhizobium rhizogenes]NTF88537.1 S49 family peptidase [Rhizobium rhizogenes]
MPNWSSVLREISVLQATATVSPHDVVRRRYLRKLFRHTGRNVIAYYSGFLSKRVEGTVLTDEDKNGFMLCIHGLDRNKGLDLILHTPGGDSQATVSLVDYLRSMFGDNMRAIVPQLAMSAGTMIACSCQSIVMGKHSSLGPVDPQFGVIAAANILSEVRKAKDEIIKNPNSSFFWNPILSQITPSFIERCELAVQDSNRFIEETLRKNMLSGLQKNDQDAALKQILAVFANNEGKAHNTHIQAQQCLDVGLKIEALEDDPVLQDLVLTIHHCYMHTLMNTAAFKMVENHLGKALVRQQAMQILQGMPAPSLAVSEPLQPTLEITSAPTPQIAAVEHDQLEDPIFAVT